MNKTPKYYLGVDGGGSKTTFVLISDQGDIQGFSLRGSAYHIQIGVPSLVEMLCNGISDVLGQADLTEDNVEAAFFGIPAYGEDSRIDNYLNQSVTSLIKNTVSHCGNDMICGWAGSHACQDGVNIVAGTGSIAYGEHNGLTARTGGWGENFGDEGSAYWIAREGLSAFSRMSDNRLKRNALYDVFRPEFDAEQDLDIAGHLNELWNGSRDHIASFSQLVSEAADQGDPTAIDIFTRAGISLAEHAIALHKALDYKESETIKLSWSGGVFKSGNKVLQPFKDHLDNNEIAYELLKPEFSAPIGAALYAAHLSKDELSIRALSRIKTQAHNLYY